MLLFCVTGHDLERMFLSPGPQTESVEGSYLCLVPAYSTPPRYDHTVECCHWMLDQCYEIGFILNFNKHNISNVHPVLTVQYIGYKKSGIQLLLLTSSAVTVHGLLMTVCPECTTREGYSVRNSTLDHNPQIEISI